MGWFDRLFRKRLVIEADDQVFGPIIFEQGIWTFIPNLPTEGFMITVEAPESGPSQLQRAFFLKIRASLSDFDRRARDFMRSRVEPSVEVSRLSIYSVEIGDDGETSQQRFVLEMCDAEAIVVHRVSFSGNEPIEYGFDG